MLVGTCPIAFIFYMQPVAVFVPRPFPRTTTTPRSLSAMICSNLVLAFVAVVAVAVEANTVGQSPIDVYPDPTSHAAATPGPGPAATGPLLGWYSLKGKC
jgi:hypothetical protein